MSSTALNMMFWQCLWTLHTLLTIDSMNTLKFKKMMNLTVCQFVILSVQGLPTNNLSGLPDFVHQVKAPHPPLFLTDNIKLDGIQQKFNEKCTPVLDFISSFEGTYESYRIQLPFLLFLLVLHQLIHQHQISYFTNFQNFNQPYLKKYFRNKFSFVNRFTVTTPLKVVKMFLMMLPYGRGKFLISLDGSRILGSIGIK